MTPDRKTACSLPRHSKAYNQHTAAIRHTIDRVICVDGLKVFRTIAFGYGSGSGADVSNIQRNEEKDGKAVSVRCKPGKQ